MSGSYFEGSYLGDRARVSDTARLECKICWYVCSTPFGINEGNTRPAGKQSRFRANVLIVSDHVLWNT